MWFRIDIFLLLFIAILSGVQVEPYLTFTNQWAVKINGTEDTARKIASHYGFIYVAKILDGYFLFRHPRVKKRSLRKNKEHLLALEEDLEVTWVQQQVAKKRVKRDLLFNDHKWPRMWYLNGGGGLLDMNVLSAWEKGYTGQGVVVSILDDGIEKDHPDLKKNYDSQASYDVNDQDPDPQPRYDYTNENRHGTRCAGEVAAEANNSICSVGVAYDARIGGVRMLDGDVTDAVEAQSLNMRPQHIAIFSASWGPDDDGKTVDGPGPLARRAFEEGIQRGRRGLGSIFVWASGNGGKEGDGCNCDGYTNSIFTLSISSTTETGQVPWYSEACSSTLATTFSSGSNVERQIVTTDLRKSCTESHTGTSASAPLAAGLAALVLQANPELTWRDLQYLVVLTAKPLSLHASDWAVNGVGRKVSHHFGYGLLDISAMVDYARNWTSVPEQHRCEIHSKQAPRIIPFGGHVESILYSDGCTGRLNQVGYLEHVQAVVTLSSSRRGEVEIILTSPLGTRSMLLARRNKDNSEDGFNAWAFMTTHSWGEPSQGNWKLEVRNGASIAKLLDWSLVLYGTELVPHRGWFPPSIKKSHYKRATLRTWSLVMHGTSLPPVPPRMFPPRKSPKSNAIYYSRDFYFSTSSKSTAAVTTAASVALQLLTFSALVRLNSNGDDDGNSLFFDVVTRLSFCLTFLLYSHITLVDFETGSCAVVTSLELIK